MGNLPSDIIARIHDYRFLPRCTADRINGNVAVAISKAFILIVFKNSVYCHISSSGEASLSKVGLRRAQQIQCNCLQCTNNVHFNLKKRKKKPGSLLSMGKQLQQRLLQFCLMYRICFVFTESIFH